MTVGHAHKRAGSAFICLSEAVMEVGKGPAVVIFARHPTPGAVKTRLARDTGAAAAAQFYRICAEHVIRQALRSGFKCCLYYSVAEEEEAVKSWLAPLGQGLTFQSQLATGTLGDRMYHAMASCLALDHDKVLIIGTDVPDLHQGILAQALAALDDYQLVFGPAEDGGYYLLGVTALPERLFDGIQWSTENVLQFNLANAQRLGLTVAPLSTLPMLADIDTVVDLQRWANAQQESSQQQDEHVCRRQHGEQMRAEPTQQPCDVVQGQRDKRCLVNGSQLGSCTVLDAALSALAARGHQQL